MLHNYDFFFRNIFHFFTSPHSPLPPLLADLHSIFPWWSSWFYFILQGSLAMFLGPSLRRWEEDGDGGGGTFLPCLLLNEIISYLQQKIYLLLQILPPQLEDQGPERFLCRNQCPWNSIRSHLWSSSERSSALIIPRERRCTDWTSCSLFLLESIWCSRTN